MRRYAKDSDDGITVKDMNDIIANRGRTGPGHRGEGSIHFSSGQSLVNSEKRINDIAKSLTPYSKCLPGTPMSKALLRTQALSIVSSPVVLERGQFTWFFTRAHPDLPSPYLYAIIDHGGDSSRSYSDSFESVKQLDEKSRLIILRNHPALSVRCYYLQQMAYWDNILMGKSKPLGEVTDYIKSGEFQNVGTPHTHSLIATRSHNLTGEEIHSDDVEIQKRLLNFVGKYATAVLLDREDCDHDELPSDKDEILDVMEGEKDSEYRPLMSYLNDASDPRR